MANHCFNSISIDGPKSDVKSFMIASRNSETGSCLDLNAILPVPQKFNNANHSTSDHQEKNELSQRDQSDNLELYQCIRDNWGSKWVYCCDDHWDETESDNGESLNISICAETAWSPPANFFLNVSKKYPTLTFFNEFNEPGAKFIGDHVIKDGCWVRRIEPDWDSEEGVEMRKEQGVFSDEDEEDAFD